MNHTPQHAPPAEIQIAIDQAPGSGGQLLLLHIVTGPARYSVAYPTANVEALITTLQEAKRRAQDSRIVLPGGVTS